MYFLSLFVVASSSIMLSIKVFGYPLSQFYPFGLTAGDSSLPANDDGSTSSIPISVPFPFFGPSFSFIYVNNNGDVTFESSLRQYTAQAFPINGSHKMIAPFWTDISTSLGGFLWYRSTTDFSILQLGTNIIRSAFPSFVTFSANWMMVVTWEEVAAYGCSDTGTITCQQRNTFQLVLITNGVHSFVVFNYNKITWTKSTQVGINAGDGINYYSVPGSMKDSMLNLTQMSNVGVPGQFVFRVDVRVNLEFNYCYSSPCVYGSCSRLINGYVCNCTPGYTGSRCDTNVNECASSPCVNGTCSDRVNGYVCNCTLGYTGSRCNIDINECSSSPCISGTCTDRVNGYVCNCMPGYTGSRCNIDIDECEVQPCQNNGTCTDLINGYQCHCRDGFNGTNCIHNIDDCLPDPCQNNGTCTDLINDYQCDCVLGFNGTHCENNIDECLPDPCQNKGTCADLVNDYECDCVTGFNGRNCENNIDECAALPCQNNGTCTDLINDYQCHCTDGFNGTNCSINIDECLPDPCQNNGTCTDLVNNYKCDCVAGFNGTNCENNIDECAAQPCQNNGTCEDLINNYRCRCTDGFNGTHCSNNIDDCVPDPCQNNGTCTDLVNDYQCYCVAGFNGTNCDINIDECATQPCQNNGTCEDLINDYQCRCTDGFNGTTCLNNIDDCIPVPCQNNGTCTDLVNDYHCDCVLGFNGTKCENNIDDCEALPCQNNGTCTDLINDYQCHCTDGFNGRNCSNNIDECEVQPCQNNGTCTDLINGYQCHCRDGFNGTNCIHNIDDCLPDPCKNNGTCTDLVNDYQCDCLAGFNGTHCENNIDECLPDPCQNNGTCTDLVNDYECDCVAGFNGRNCENNIDECAALPCQNNGTCTDLINDYQCHCMDGFNGTNCSINIDECLPDPCQNNGTCTDLVNNYQCDCVAGFNGTNCENNIDECATQHCQNNGTCVDLINNYQCRCTDGFNGRHCSNNIDDCVPDPCQNNGTCTDLVNDYQCYCVAGFNGTNCDTNIDECASQPCQNNGTCEDLINDYQCRCKDGFNGTTCLNNIDDCRPVPCQNNGTCTDLVNDFHCDCVLGFNGTNCENNIDDCEAQPCQNNGTCTDMINDYLCNCTVGFNGRNCSNNIDECAAQPCQNNGTCTDLINDYLCQCIDGFNGTNCTHNIDECLPDPCQNNGTCIDLVNDYRCYCVAGFNGTNCENIILQILNFESSSSVLREGKSAWFSLQLKSNTMYEVQWFHSGYLISNSSRRYKLTSLHTGNNMSLHTLHINDVLQRDKGEWKITVTNHVIYLSSHLIVTVIPRLVLIMTPQYDFSIMTGEKINLQCTVSNPESLLDVTNGSLVMTKDGTVLSDFINSHFSTTWSKTTAKEDDTGRYTCTHSSYQDPIFVSVYVTVFKPEQKRCESEWSEGILWNTTLANTTKQELCPVKQKGMAIRYCTQLGVWESPSLINCTTEAFTSASSEMDAIIEDGLENTEKVQEAVNNTLQLMKNLTSSTNELSAGDLSSSLDVLEKIVNVTNSTGSAIEKEVFYAVIDNVLSPNNSKSWTTVSNKTDKDASSILKNMERISEIVIQSGNITASRFSGSNFELTVNQTKIDETGIRFPVVSPSNTSEITEKNPTFLELPKQNMKAENAINYVAVIYKTMSDILPSASDIGQNGGNSEQKSKKKTFVNSQILSLTTQNDLGELVPPLTLTFGHITNNESTRMQARCVSWDFTKSKWTEKGCNVKQSDHKETVCQCNHLTNFAILMRPYSPVIEDHQSLKTMSLIGVILSILFTALTLVIYILTWRYIKSDQNIIMMNLCGSLILSYLIFISAVEQKSNEGACIAITAIIHYLFLVTFLSMLGMAVYYFISITVTYYAMYVANNFKSKSRIQWFLLAIWGIPILITSITLGAFWGKGYHLQSYCWLSMESGSLYMFIIPVCLICVLNVLIIVSLVRVLCASSAMMKSSLQKKATSGLRSLGTLLPVLGVTWLFGILAVNENADVFQYIFVIANSLQGFFIFVSHVLLNKKVIQGLRNRYPVISSLKTKAEHGKPEADSASQSQSTSKSNSALVTTKKKSIFQRILDSKEENLDLTERTISTDIHSSVTHEKNSAVPENKSTNLTVTLLGRGEQRISVFLHFKPVAEEKCTVTEM
nr:uncharacterized protein LOC105329357 isoform X6 [Crassostrea gigas]